MIEAFLATYAAVFLAEIVGDKLLYTSGVLAMRFRWGAVISGMSMAFMAKMAVAVAVGAAIGRLLPSWLVAGVTAGSFVGVAIAMWRKPDLRTADAKDRRVFRGAAIAFATIFCSEWGDKGMTTAGAWAAAYVSGAATRGLNRTSVALLVWVAAFLAMVTKGGLAVTLGAGVRAWIATHVQPRQVRTAAVAALIALGVLSVLEVTGILVG